MATTQIQDEMLKKVDTIIQDSTFIEKKKGHTAKGKGKTLFNAYKIYKQPCGNRIAVVECNGPYPHFLIDLVDWNRIKIKPNGDPVTWYASKASRPSESSYIKGRYPKKLVQLHQVITNTLSRGNKGRTVHHGLNGGPANNLRSNLDPNASKSKQSINRHGSRGVPGTKMVKKGSKEDLPMGLKRKDLPLYVTCQRRKKDGPYRYFRIAAHPLQKNKRRKNPYGKYPTSICSRQANDVSWEEKYAEILEKLRQLNKELVWKETFDKILEKLPKN